MKVFYGKGSWSGKVNFVDDNNVLVGYTNEDDCCARGGWFLATDQKAWLEKTFTEGEMDLPGWVFDTKYFEEIGLPNGDNEGGAVQFRLARRGPDVLDPLQPPQRVLRERV